MGVIRKQSLSLLKIDSQRDFSFQTQASRTNQRCKLTNISYSEKLSLEYQSRGTQNYKHGLYSFRKTTKIPIPQSTCARSISIPLTPPHTIHNAPHPSLTPPLTNPTPQPHPPIPPQYPQCPQQTPAPSPTAKWVWQSSPPTSLSQA